MFWVGQQTQLSLIERSDRNLAWIHLTFLLGISLVPFASLRYLERSELLKPGGDADIGAIRRRIGYVQAVRRGGRALRGAHLSERSVTRIEFRLRPDGTMGK